MSRTARSVGAVVAGVLVNFVAASAIDFALHTTGVYPPVGQSMSSGLFALATAYRLAIAVAGGYVTARLAPAHPMKHALILGAVGTVLGVAGAVAMWSAGPHWYPIALVVTAVPCCWLGGRLAS
jgi:hypothetical protein